jgi:hypothetical protein
MLDKLDDIVAKQLVIANKWHDVTKMDQAAKEKATHEYLTAVIAEVGEILNGDDISGIKGQGAIRWKSWKKNVQPADPVYVKTELIDILHFTLEMLIIWGCDAEEIHWRYVDKQQENLARYKNGY